MNNRRDAVNDPPDSNRDVLVSDGYDFAVAWYNGESWEASNDILEAENYDGGAQIRLAEEPVYWWELPIIEKE